MARWRQSMTDRDRARSLRSRRKRRPGLRIGRRVPRGERWWPRAGATEAATRRKDNGLKTEAAPADEDLGHGVELRTAGYSCRIPVDPNIHAGPGPAFTGRVDGSTKGRPELCVNGKRQRRWGPPCFANRAQSTPEKANPRPSRARASWPGTELSVRAQVVRPSWVSTVVVALLEF